MNKIDALLKPHIYEPNKIEREMLWVWKSRMNIKWLLIFSGVVAVFITIAVILIANGEFAGQVMLVFFMLVFIVMIAGTAHDTKAFRNATHTYYKITVCNKFIENITIPSEKGSRTTHKTLHYIATTLDPSMPIQIAWHDYRPVKAGDEVLLFRNNSIVFSVIPWFDATASTRNKVKEG